MEWIQILSVFLANAGLILWFRSESRNDWRHMDQKVDAIHQEIKDFHIHMERLDTEFKMYLINKGK